MKKITHPQMNITLSVLNDKDCSANNSYRCNFVVIWSIRVSCSTTMEPVPGRRKWDHLRSRVISTCPTSDATRSPLCNSVKEFRLFACSSMVVLLKKMISAHRCNGQMDRGAEKLRESISARPIDSSLVTFALSMAIIILILMNADFHSMQTQISENLIEG